MNRKIGLYSSIINAAAVAAFALSMIFGSDSVSYIASMFIAFSFVPLIAALCSYSGEDKKAAGFTSIVFAAVYSVFILAVYFAQVTTVAEGGMTGEASRMLDYSKYGLFFNYDLLGYGIMALATFFVGLTIDADSKAGKWLKGLLMVHGIFFLSSFILPMLGLFSSDMEGADWIGIAVLEFWCVYFIPIGVLAFFHFKRRRV